MFAKIHLLPSPLKVVVWLNLVLGLIAFVEGVASVASAPGLEIFKALASAIISILVVIGIIARSRVVRMLILVFAWFGMVVYGFALVFGIFVSGIAAVVVLIPLAISAVTIWGLRAPESKLYFRIGGPEDKSVARDWMGNPLNPPRDGTDA